MSVEVETPAAPYDVFCRTLRSRGPILNMLFEQARISLEREGDTILRDAFAGALVAVLHDMLLDLWVALGATKSEWKHCGPGIQGWSVAYILSAALDNSRHFMEWDAEKSSVLMQRRSVKVLCTALGVPVKKASKRAPFRGNVCWAVLEALTAGGGYGAIEALVREFAASLHGKHESLIAT